MSTDTTMSFRPAHKLMGGMEVIAPDGRVAFRIQPLPDGTGIQIQGVGWYVSGGAMYTERFLIEPHVSNTISLHSMKVK